LLADAAERRRLGGAGRARPHARFTQQAVVEDTMAFYRHVLSLPLPSGRVRGTAELQPGLSA
jgi:hypothetical protein